LVPFTNHLNTKSRTTGAPIISKWVFTEAQTGRGRLETHFSYIKSELKAFVEDGSDIVLEDDILEALSFRGGIAGTFLKSSIENTRKEIQICKSL